MTEPSLEEILELIWTIEEEKGEVERNLLLKKLDPSAAEKNLNILRHEGRVKINNSVVELTKKGREEARTIIRRHRLAERLLHDVLDIKEEAMDSSACMF